MASDRIGYLVLMGVLLAIAAAADVAGRRIPNAIPVALFVGGLALHLTAGGWRAAASSAAVALALGILLMIPWSMRLLGGGDLKLLTGAAAWVGPGRIGALLLATALCGAVLAIPFLRGVRTTVNELAVTAAQGRLSGGARPAPARRRSIPFAVAIAAGAVAAVVVG